MSRTLIFSYTNFYLTVVYASVDISLKAFCNHGLTAVTHKTTIPNQLKHCRGASLQEARNEHCSLQMFWPIFINCLKYQRVVYNFYQISIKN